jgi:hypothetical protein
MRNNTPKVPYDDPLRHRKTPREKWTTVPAINPRNWLRLRAAWGWHSAPDLLTKT